jgi:hypothetical protein
MSLTTSGTVTDDGSHGPDPFLANNTASDTVDIRPPKVFALAYSNLDGQPGFDPNGDDRLIARLVDTYQDNLVSVGDTIETGTFPSDTTGVPRTSVGVQSHTVATVVNVFSAFIQVRNADGADFQWIGGFSYSEDTAGVGTEDSSQVISGSGSCEALVGVNSPSHPTASSDVRSAPPCPNLLTIAYTP